LLNVQTIESLLIEEALQLSSAEFSEGEIVQFAYAHGNPDRGSKHCVLALERYFPLQVNGL
jgi:hypothetical protein